MVCVARGFERGDADLRRFVRRHNRYWDVTPSARLAGDRGRIVKGVSHVDPDLAFDFAVRGFRRVPFDRFTRRALSWVSRRDESHGLWRVGEPYANASYLTTRLDVRDLKVSTAFTLQGSLAQMMRRLRASAVLTLLLFLFGIFALVSGAMGVGTLLTVAAIVALVFSLRSAYRLGRAVLVERRPDAILLDVGCALLLGLQDAGLVGRGPSTGSLRVSERPDGYEISLDDAPPEDAAVFVRSYGQIFAPVRDQRYLILRDGHHLPNAALRHLWTPIGPFFRRPEDYPPSFHPVPDVLATRKERTEAFSRHWQRYVGDGTFVYTRTSEGRRMLLNARAQRRPEAGNLAFEVWE